MEFIVKPSRLNGAVNIPGSKSHTIRALACGLLGDGESFIEHPLDSSDTRSCLNMVRNFGARVDTQTGVWKIIGTGGKLAVPADIIDVGNSGTSLYIGLGLASLVDGYSVFTGDHQIRSRPADGLIASINDLGGVAFSTRGNGMPPVVVKGRITGGTTEIQAVTSQYLTSLLIAAPLAERKTVIKVPLLNEKPYVAMTLCWLDKLGIRFAEGNYEVFTIPGGQKYRTFRENIAADFSSATFFLVAAAITGSELVLRGLDWSDTQGDKEVVNILKFMGAGINIGKNEITVSGGRLNGGIFDLNAIPDSLPALSVAACFADGETRLVNVPQARLKETDRIRVMHDELVKMGARVEELPDGLVIRRSSLRGCRVSGHHDHRVAMALAVAGLAADGETRIETAESVSVTFPDFPDLMKSIGADIKRMELQYDGTGNTGSDNR
ncbi:MAG: 3-phosphoshikimate 1-carboxyvinyltransferase [Spirochaetes bacterium RBG_13_51_14]|nr:MAG: 3-phosphoshikimate 1-carboxyvinyltransferase [Spirochaetes bacterium RBG_13_51_14]